MNKCREDKINLLYLFPKQRRGFPPKSTPVYSIIILYYNSIVDSALHLKISKCNSSKIIDETFVGFFLQADT